MSLPLTTASPLPGVTTHFCRNLQKIMSHVKEEATESLKKEVSSTLQMYFSHTAQSYIFTLVCIKNKKHMNHYMAFLQERYTKERQVRDENCNGESGLKAKLKHLLQSYNLGCEGLYGCGSCWRSSASFVMPQHQSHWSERTLLCYPVRQEPRCNLHSDSVGSFGGKKSLWGQQLAVSVFSNHCTRSTHGRERYNPLFLFLCTRRR